MKPAGKKSGRSSRMLLILTAILLAMAGIYFSSEGYREKIAWLFASPGQRLLQATVVNNQEAVVKALQDGADVNSSVYNRWTALHMAAHEGYDNLIDVLVNAKANIEARNIYGWTPLAVAAYEGKLSTVEKLLERHADIQTRNVMGNTPLHLAVSTNNQAMTELLLRHNAKINQKNESGSTPLDFAVNQHDAKLARLLLEHNADPNSAKNNFERDSTPPLARAAIFGDIRNAALLLEYRAEINRADKHGNTPLHEAVKNHRELMVKFLLFNQAPTDCRNERGETPLDLARKENIGIIMAFARHGHYLVLKENVQHSNVIFATTPKRKL